MRPQQHVCNEVSLEFENSRIEKRNRVNEKANKMDHEKEIAEVLCGG